MPGNNGCGAEANLVAMNVRTLNICRRKRPEIIAKRLSWHKGECWGNLVPRESAVTNCAQVYLPVAREELRIQDNVVLRADALRCRLPLLGDVFLAPRG